jgi:transposase-like protein
VKIRDEATVRIKAVYLALAVLPDGSRDILGIWIEQTEGAKFWMKVFTDLKSARLSGHPDCRDRRTQGMEEALAAVFPADHPADLHRPSAATESRLRNWKQRKPLAVALRTIYTRARAPISPLAPRRIRARGWGQRCPTIVAAWRRA